MSTLVLVAALSLAGGATAFAHGEDGTFSGTEAVPTDGDPLTVSLRARLLYVNDNDPAPGAAATADAIGPDGATAAPTPLTDNGDGTYEGTLVLGAPGAWTIRLTATTPNAATEVAYTADAPPTPVPLTSVPPTTREPEPPDSEDDDGSGTGVVVLAVMAVAAIAIGGWLLWRRRR